MNSWAIFSVFIHSHMEYIPDPAVLRDVNFSDI